MKRHPYIVRGLLLAAFLFSLQTGSAALNAYLELKLNGNDIAGDTTVVSIGGVDVSDHIECIAFNHEVFTSGASRATHGPIKFVKRVDKSSPLLYQGFGQNMNADVKFRFFRNNPDDGSTEHYYTITLQNARIASIRHWFPNTTDSVGASLPQMEEVSFTYQSITIIHEISATETTLDVSTAQ